MLRFEDLRMSVEGRPLLDGASAVIPAGRRVGVVGRNGCGKSTLFRAIRGELSLDVGRIEMPSAWRVGGVAQEAPAGPESLLDTVLVADTERAALLAEAETATDPARIADIQTRLADIDAHSAEARAAQILAGLGFDAAAQGRPCAEFSGGWRMRVALAAVLFARPDLLLLDEPTNYLDLEGAVWLEGFLARYPATMLAISHDRGLLNRSVQSILHLTEQRLDYYATPFDAFAETRAARALGAEAAAKRQAAERARLEAFVTRFRAKASKARQAQSRVKMLERMTPIATIAAERTAPLSFPAPETLAPPMIAFDDAAVGYAADTPVLSQIRLRLDPDDRIALLGANGQGKSTLVKLMAGRLDPMAGAVSRHRKLRVGYFAQHQLDELDGAETPLDAIRRRRPTLQEKDLRARLGGSGIGADLADTETDRLSGGQKARLLLCLAALDAPQLLILDEPTNHLDMETRAALVEALADYTGAVVLVSHDADLVGQVADRLWLVQGGRVREFDGDIAAYREQVLAGTTDAGSGEAGAPAENTRRARRRDEAAARARLAPLRSEVTKAEARVAKLEEMRATVEARLADPALYEGSPDRIEALGRKRAEVADGLARAEALWLEAVTALEEAEAAAE